MYIASTKRLDPGHRSLADTGSLDRRVGARRVGRRVVALLVGALGLEVACAPAAHVASEDPRVADESLAYEPYEPSRIGVPFRRHGCDACHGTSAEQGVVVGPNLFGRFGSTTATSARGTPFDEAYLLESLEDPNAKIAAGFEGKRMPSFRGLSGPERVALVAYLRSLR